MQKTAQTFLIFLLNFFSFSASEKVLVQHTGYLEAQQGQHTFYWFVEAENGPKSAPLLIWMNGGPGASSLTGMLTELGPRLLNERSLPDDSGKWTLFSNPYSWHKVANLLVWEQPAGVGFSYCSSKEACPLPWDDTSSKIANLKIILKFFEKYPDFKNADTYIAGESYGGIYVPLLAESIIEYNKDASDAVNLKGIAVGNGCIGFEMNGGACGRDSTAALLDFMEGNGAIEKDEALSIRTVCGNQLIHGGVGPGTSGFTSECAAALKNFAQILGDYNRYNFASTCGPDGMGNFGDGSAFTCGADLALTKYLNDESIRKDIGTYGIGPSIWKDWDGDNLDLYNISTANAITSYRAVIAAGIRVLVYIGIRDAGGPNFDARDWIQSIGGEIVSRRTWMVDGHAAGREFSYENNVTYVTLRGAGHLVPATRPKEALAMIRSWLSDSPLPKYDRGCERIWLGRGWANFCDDT